jgi:hypothetical protein
MDAAVATGNHNTGSASVDVLQDLILQVTNRPALVALDLNATLFQ